MVQRRTKVSLSHWRTANNALYQSLRAGYMEGAKRCARTLLSYLGEMGLLDDLDRQGNTPGSGDFHNGAVVKTEAKMIDAT